MGLVGSAGFGLVSNLHSTPWSQHLVGGLLSPGCATHLTADGKGVRVTFAAARHRTRLPMLE